MTTDSKEPTVPKGRSPKMIKPKVQIFKRAKPAPKKIIKLLRNFKGGTPNGF